MSDPGLSEYRVFISSPSDVAEERARALAVIERLNGEFEGRVRLVPIAWERRTYGAHTDFQSQIEKTRDCHLVVGILWSTIGSPLHASTYSREDGTAFESGTAFEIETALEMRQRAPQPDVTLFLKTSQPDIEFNASSAAALGERLALLERIVQRWTSHQGGESKAAFNKFGTPARFEALFERHLRDWLEQRGHNSDGVIWRIRRRGEEDRVNRAGFAGGSNR